MSELKVKRFVSAILEENTYLLCGNGGGILIDPSCDAREIEDFVEKNKIEIMAILLTHGHFDHCMQVKHFQDKGVKCYIHEAEAEKLFTKKNYSLSLRLPFDYTRADVLLKGGEVLNFSDIEIKVLHTPGHSAGGVCFISEDNGCIFTGDTLFKLSFGRTDFYDGDFDKICESIGQLFSFDKDYTLYPGHGEATTLSYEKRNNPILLEGLR